jgi:hypothetical protein
VLCASLEPTKHGILLVPTVLTMVVSAVRSQLVETNELHVPGTAI